MAEETYTNHLSKVNDMNKYLFAMILSLSLWSCGSNDDGVDNPNNPNNPGNPDNVTLELSTKDLVFEAQGGN